MAWRATPGHVPARFEGGVFASAVRLLRASALHRDDCVDGFAQRCDVLAQRIRALRRDLHRA
jgi:hypothetical protein